VHHVGLKTILWGTIAAKFSCVRGIVNAVSGMEILFSDENSSLTAKLILKVFWFSHRRNNLMVIFQNNEDCAIFLKYRIIKEEQIVMIKGSGVELDKYTYIPEPTSAKIRVIFTARMIVEKGVYTLIEAAQKLKENYYHKVEFLLCGGLDNNPFAIIKEYLHSVSDGTYIQWLGHRSDVLDLLKSSHIMVFPSYYREGVPKSLIEAAAVGRPIITTNSIGCKETVIDGYNGYLIPVKDSSALADKLKILIENENRRIEMGKNSRSLAEKEFSIDNVIAKHLFAYQKVLTKG
jgi:glycosyltransferase involved in cell wall biosynthesis